MQAPDGAPLLIARPGRQGPLGAAAVRPDLAVVARPRGRRAAGRTAAPHRPLADAGAGAGGERADRARSPTGRLTIERRSTDPAPPADVTVTDPGRQHADGEADREGARPGDATPAGDHARRLAGTSDGHAPPMPRPARPTRWSSPTCAPLRRWSASWSAPRAAACTGSTPASRGRAGRAGTAPHRAGPRRLGRLLDRAGAAARSHLVTGIAALALLPAWVALPLMLGLLVLGWRREGT